MGAFLRPLQGFIAALDSNCTKTGKKRNKERSKMGGELKHGLVIMKTDLKCMLVITKKVKKKVSGLVIL